MNQPSDPISTANVERLVLLIQLLGETLHLAADRARVRQTMEELIESPRFIADGGPLEVLRQAAPHLGLDFAANDLSSTDAWAMVADGFPVVICLSETHFLLLESVSGMRLEASELERDEHRRSTLSSADLRAYWGRESTRRCLMVNRSMHQAADTVAGHHGDGLGGHGHGHPKPMKRFLTLLRLETRDILTLALFGLVSGVLGLATPLAVESLVNTVAWGTYLQPLFVLSLILFGFLSFAGTLKLLQVIIAEVVQRRVFVRIVGDLAHRFPLAKRDSLVNEHPSELANRYFDIMTIQKATASLLLDGISIVLQTVIGMLLLAVYHPFLLGFDIILLVTMTLFTYLLGRGGVRTAIDESKIKYEMAHWLQDVLSMPTAFRLHGG